DCVWRGAGSCGSMCLSYGMDTNGPRLRRDRGPLMRRIDLAMMRAAGMNRAWGNGSRADRGRRGAVGVAVVVGMVVVGAVGIPGPVAVVSAVISRVGRISGNDDRVGLIDLPDAQRKVRRLDGEAAAGGRVLRLGGSGRRHQDEPGRKRDGG